MWIITLFSALFLCVSSYASAENHEKRVNMQDLPQNVQQFLTTHFANMVANTTCMKEKDNYKVVLANGYEVEFDHKGNWDEIDNELHAALPQSVINMLPQNAVNYINANFPNAAVYSIDRDHKGYEVKLHGNKMAELRFDKQGNLLQHKTKD